ncbi:GNAT family N-acetyltransferase [Desertibaculum subflavum]|uniref:GNAT family N-acetyltransferase n=1 Tax=Desertibaculum subflavum TaxID=2268458 RepID=UPI000E66D2A2
MSADEAFLTGHTIYLRQPVDADVTEGNWHRWYNDQAVTRFNTHGVYPISREQELDYVRAAMARASTLLLAVCEKGSDRLLGNVALQNIDLINRKANIGLTLGEEAGLTAGVEAFGLVCDHAFSRLNLNRVADGTHEKLEPFARMIGVLGFAIEGRGRQDYLRDGRAYDQILFGCLAADFLRLKVERDGRILFATVDELTRAVVQSVRSPARDTGAKKNVAR